MHTLTASSLMHRRNLSGFTLVELSVVLVIIGLLAGGILVGRDLIEAARIRSQITQIEKLKTTVNTFRVKYNDIPGDLPATQAQAFGFTTRSGAPAHGDGNGTLESCTTTGAIVSDLYMGCETALFWSDLSKANLMEGSFISAIDDYTVIGAGADQYLPTAKIGGRNYVAVFSDALMQSFSDPGAGHCEQTFCFSIIKNIQTLPPNGRVVMNAGVTPLQASTMDNKVDDGLPLTGSILSGPTAFADNTGDTLFYIPNINSTRCRNNTAANTYNLTPDKANLVECIMNFVHR